MAQDQEFSDCFESLAGKKPLSWQSRLYQQWSIPGAKPSPVIDLPTGMGKTMVMAIWLFAREKNPALGRRLIYVVDRRTVVDQATDLATCLQKTFGKDKLAISTLRGQLADNREWSRDPTKPAIIIGTVDLIGSALLFSGYRSSYKRRPLEAGLFGQDSLLVLDEAHLSKPFEQLLIGRKREDGIRDNGIEHFQSGHGSPMRVIRMSATSDETAAEKVFRLDTDPNNKTFDLWSQVENGKETNPVKLRFEATKHLVIEESKDVIDSIATKAGDVATSKPGSRIVIFVKSPKDVEAVRKALTKEDKSRERKIAQLTGTMRGLERDELVTPPTNGGQHERRVMQRFLHPDNDPSLGECFLISTSAGEVGFDLNADHMVCDAAPLDSMIQRLGRVNRRGEGDATVVLIHEPIKVTDKEGKPRSLEGLEKSIAATLKLLKPVANVSPQNIAALKTTSEWTQKYADACSPTPTTVDLTDILLDAWSMTSITQLMPGRPEVAPWLRGIADDQLETTIAWRAELDLDGFDQLDLEDVEEWFDTHRILTHETLTVPTGTAATKLVERWNHLSTSRQNEIGDRQVIIDRGGLFRITLRDLFDELQRKPANIGSIRNADLILPASFGGIERGVGLLDPAAPKKPEDARDADDDARAANASARIAAPDVADVHQRHREQITRNEDGEPDKRSIGSGTMPENPARFVLDLASDDDKRVQLVSYVPKPEKLEWGTKPLSLTEHVERVEQCATTIAQRLPELSDTERQALSLAAQYHDHGKNRDRWQHTVKGKATPAGSSWNSETLGKSGGTMLHDSRGYRHEFGSLREFTDAFKAGKLLDQTGSLIVQNVFDLSAHLIATHHGRGRPHFPKGAFDPDAEPRSNEIHTAALRRFARLQRKYGWWRLTWLENLLRCADAMASAENDGATE